MKKILLITFSLAFLSSACGKQQSPPLVQPTTDLSAVYNRQLLVGDKILNVEIVSTTVDMAQGLSGRGKLTDTQGMLFDFGTSTAPGFWMKDMKFNLDLVWISGEKIIGITKNVPAPQSPDNNLPIYYPPSPTDKVLEVNAGWTEKNDIAVGDAVTLSQQVSIPK